MVTQCIVCKRKALKGEGISFHRLPTDENLRQKWLESCNLLHLSDKEYTNLKICSNHFNDSDFKITKVGGHKFLQPEAVPTIFSNNFSTTDSNAEIEINNIPSCSKYNETTIKTRKNIFEIDLEDFTDKKTMKHNFELMKQELKNKQRKIKTLQERTYRLERKIDSLQLLIEQFRCKKRCKFTEE